MLVMGRQYFHILADRHNFRSSLFHLSERIKASIELLKAASCDTIPAILCLTTERVERFYNMLKHFDRITQDPGVMGGGSPAFEVCA